jgi:hypothetical protein
VLWEIKLVQQKPIRVEVDDDRNLRAEYEALMKRPWWRRRVTWRVTDTVTVHIDAVMAVQKAPKPRKGKPLGF